MSRHRILPLDISAKGLHLLRRHGTYHAFGQLVVICVDGEFAGVGMSMKCTEASASFTAAFMRRAGMRPESVSVRTTAQRASDQRQERKPKQQPPEEA